MFKAYVITIMNNEKSLQVAKRCTKSAAYYGIEDVELFKATTPKDKPIKMLKDRGIEPAGFTEVYSRPERCMSGFLSHHRLWEQCAEENDEPYIIFVYVMLNFAPLYLQSVPGMMIGRMMGVCLFIIPLISSKVLIKPRLIMLFIVGILTFYRFYTIFKLNTLHILSFVGSGNYLNPFYSIFYYLFDYYPPKFWYLPTH